MCNIQAGSERMPHDLSHLGFLAGQIFFFYRYGDHRDLHSFPTRRSSDLCSRGVSRTASQKPTASTMPGRLSTIKAFCRSEEHTSELQSHSDLVCRLLL